MKSNLETQLFVFQDRELIQPAEDFLLEAMDCITVYICLQPSAKASYASGSCREIVGGLRIKISEKQYEKTIKFTAIVGKSTMKVLPKVS
jgi:hypothetical protein